MARSHSIWAVVFVTTEGERELVAAFTVKHEMLRWVSTLGTEEREQIRILKLIDAQPDKGVELYVS